MMAFVASCWLEIAALRLLALDGLEERLEIALAEAAGAFALDDLEENRRPILHVAREDLKQVAVVVAIHQDAQLRQLAQWLIDLANALLQFLIVGRDALR